MKRLIALICALFAVVSVSAQQLPDVQVETADGRMVSIREYAGEKPLIISYWMITCKSCIPELNALNDQMEEWLEEGDFEVIAISKDDVRLKATAKAKARSMGWNFVCLYDANQDLSRAMNVSLTPHTFVVDREGNIVSSHTSYLPGSEIELFEQVIELAK